MRKRIKKAGIIGSGVMGSGIAAQLANAGIRSYLLDIVPGELSAAEQKKGLTKDSPAFRSKIAEANKQNLTKARPPLLMNKSDIDLITAGNIEDNLDWLSECDWVVEAITENLEVKKNLLKKIAPYIKPGTIVSSNTSSISVTRIAEDMPLEFRQNWLGTHFFNPVRYMKLYEIIPGKDTLPEIVEFMADFGERIMGKGVVYAKDTPAFVSNRFGNWAIASAANLMYKYGLTTAEVDAILGAPVGRPNTGIFGLADLVGLDVVIASVGGVYHNVSDPDEIAAYKLPDIFEEMKSKNLMGNKVKQGFYKRQGKEKFMLDLNTMEYTERKGADFESLRNARSQKSLAEKMVAFFESDDIAAQFVWEHLSGLFLYAAAKIPEVSDDVVNIDRGLTWGYNFGAGPFEMWNGIDLAKYVTRMESEGKVVPAWVKEMLAAGINSFYKTENGIEYYYSVPDKAYMPIKHKPEIIILPELKGAGKVVKTSDAGTIVDIGDGVICLQLHTRNSVINAGLIKIMKEAQEELNKNWDAMVITGSGRHFCVGADLSSLIMALVENKQWDQLDAVLKEAQDVYMANKYSAKPVVVAPFGQVVGGGCEITIQSSAIQASAETFMGLVEVGVGLIPAGGGVKEMTLRAIDRVKGVQTRGLPDFVAAYFQTIFNRQVSASAKDARNLGYLRETDGITMNPDYLLADAKRTALRLLEDNYNPPVSRPVPAPGRNYIGTIHAFVRGMNQAGYISEYDAHIGFKIADIMGGGSVTSGNMMTEQYLLDLEREAFISLCGEQKTQDRITHFLKTGKLLKN